MSWETIDPRMPTRYDSDKPRIGLVGGEATKLKGARIYMAIRFTPANVEALGAKPGDTLLVQRGTGPDIGWLRITKGSGYILRGSNSKRLRPWIGFVPWPECGTEKRPAVLVEWEKVADHVIKVRLPPWAYPQTFADQKVRKIA